MVESLDGSAAHWGPASKGESVLLAERFLPQARRAVGALFGALALASCGGGGGGGETAPAISASFAPAQLSLVGIAGYAYDLPVVVNLSYANGQATNVFIALEERNGLVVDADVTSGSSVVNVTLKMASDRPVGIHDSELIVHACVDSNCTAEVAGSPMRVGIRFEVKPQIKIQAPALMQRTGRDAAPSQTLALDFRPEMGTPALAIGDNFQAFDISLQGDRIVVNTRQLPAGEYHARVEVSGTANVLYRAEVDVRYVVDPPPGGELPLSVTPADFVLQLSQGTVTTRRFTVQRPTWTDALDPPTIDDTTVVKAVRSLGNDEYEIDIDTRAAAPLSTHFASVVIRAGPHGGVVSVGVNIRVDPP